MAEIISGLVLSAIWLLLDYFFLSGLLYNTDRKVINNFIIASGVIITSLLSFVLRDVPLIKIIITYLIAVVITRHTFAVSVKKGLIFNAIYLSVFAGCEFLSYLILKSVFDLSTIEILTNDTGAFYIELLSVFLVLVVIVISSAFMKKSSLSRMDIKGWIIFSLFPVFSVGVIFLLLIHINDFNMIRMSNALLFIGTGMIIINVALIFLLNNVINRELTISEKQQQLDSAEHIYRMYEALSNESKIQHSLSHDYRNHISTMKILADKGDYDVLKDYISEQLNDSSKIRDLFNTGNPLVDAILNRKYADASKKDVIFSIIADDLSEVGINGSDLVTILSNIIDNAIEAAQQCSNGKIILKIKIEDNDLYIDSTNTSPSDLDIEAIHTTKPDKGDHGYGLKNIRRAVAENNGKCFVECKDRLFRITIMIPLNNNSKD